MSGRIVVLGMHRSGTSCVGELLAAMGAYFGPRDMGGAGSVENPHGLFERRDLRRLCHFILQQARCEWWATSRFSPDRLPVETDVQIVGMLTPMLADLDAHEPWFIKEPRLCILLPMLRARLGPVTTVCVWRDPLEVAQSLQTRDAMPIEFGIALWERYTRASFALDAPRVIVSYNRLVADPEGVTRKLLDDLTVRGVGGLRMPAPAQLAQVIDPRLRRSAPSADASALLSPSQRRLLVALEAGDPAAELAAPLSADRLAHLGRLEEARRRQMKAAAYRSLAEARVTRSPLATRMPEALAYVPWNPMQWVKWLRQGKLGRRLHQHLDAATIALSGGFDAQWYRQRYPDLTGTEDPLMHFVRYGASEGRDPSPSYPTSRNLRAALEEATVR
ncbi:MAG TPA: sulfotransferase [Dongiaceae bacterium]|nr:sulfotransferase [Dongiaceae bacterium]